MLIIIWSFFLIPALAGTGSYFIAARVRKQLRDSGNKYAKIIAGATFIVGFLIIGCALTLLVAYNVRIER